jgi:N-acetylglutamate synthase-like GNAT family acetyltransferase
MICIPDLKFYPALYAIGLKAPELRTVPDQDFVSPEEFSRMAQEDIFLAAFEEGQPVGFVNAILWKRHGCISYLVVKDEFRKQGHGRELLTGVIKELKRQGAVNLYAWARHGSDVNHLIDKFGFHRGGNFTYVFHPLRET